jgi:HEAT repeats
VKSGADTFLDFLQKRSNENYPLDRDKLDKYLRAEPSLVMFDGLDEVVNPEKYEAVVHQITNFAKEYTKAKIIVTSRVIGYDDEQLKRASFQHFTLQELDRDQIEKFIDKWYDLALGEDPEKERLKQVLKEAIANSPAIANLADNPMLLTMMAIFNNGQKSLPKDRADLYDRASRVFLHDWDKKKSPDLSGKIDGKAKQQMLQKIAYEMQSGEKELAENLIDAGPLQDILTAYLKPKIGDTAWERAVEIIDQLRYRNYILCDRGGDTYGFVHRTFLEYFCAKEIVHQFKEKKSLSPEELQNKIFGQNWQDEAWHEVLRLICRLLEEPKDAGKLVEFLMEREVDRSAHLDDDNRAKEEAFQHLQLAVECLAKVRNPQSLSSIAAELKEKLKNEIESQSEILLSYEAANLLIDSICKYYHTPETLQWLQNTASANQEGAVRGAAAKSMAKYYRSEPETRTPPQNFADRRVVRLQDAFYQLHRLVRREAVKWIAEDDHPKPEILKSLKDIACHDRDGEVRRRVVESIGQYYHSEPETLQWLKDFAFHDANGAVQREAVKSIGQYHHTKPETLKWLQNFAFNDQDGWVRQAAVKSIGEYYHTEETLEWLKDFAVVHDQNELVRRAAVESIGEYHHTKPETLTWLQNFAAPQDRDGFVRWVAVESIGEYYHTEPETRTWLQNTALQDRDGFVRWAAVVSICQYYIQADGIFELLCQIASQDPYQSIDRYYIQNDEIFELLCQIASQDISQDDSYFNPRQTALEALVKHYIDRPEVIELLRDRSTQDLMKSYENGQRSS